jgi:hypothetical protein
MNNILMVVLGLSLLLNCLFGFITFRPLLTYKPAKEVTIDGHLSIPVIDLRLSQVNDSMLMVTRIQTHEGKIYTVRLPRTLLRPLIDSPSNKSGAPPAKIKIKIKHNDETESDPLELIEVNPGYIHQPK